MLTDEGQAVIESACRRLLAAYVLALDTGAVEDLCALFTPDCRWRRPGHEPMRSHQDIRTTFTAMAAARAAEPVGEVMRHCLTTVAVEAWDADHAASVTYALVYRAPAPAGGGPAAMPEAPEMLLEYHTGYIRSVDGWRIADHETRHVMRTGA